MQGLDSIAAVSAHNGRGMVIGTLTPEIGHLVRVTTFAEFDASDFDDCSVGSTVSTPTTDADHVAHIAFALGTLAQNAAKTVKIYYRKF